MACLFHFYLPYFAKSCLWVVCLTLVWGHSLLSFQVWTWLSAWPLTLARSCQAIPIPWRTQLCLDCGLCSSSLVVAPMAGFLAMLCALLSSSLLSLGFRSHPSKYHLALALSCSSLLTQMSFSIQAISSDESDHELSHFLSHPAFCQTCFTI